MNDWEIKFSVEHSKDLVGVIHPSAFQGQLHNLAPDDWQEAAKLYPKDPANANGFYIENNPNGQVTIHNDMSQLQQVAGSTILADCIHDGKEFGIYGAAALTGVLGSIAAVGAVNGLEAAGITAAAAGAAEATAFVAAPILAATALAGTITMAVDLGFNFLRHENASEVLKEDLSTISAPTQKSLPVEIQKA